MASNLIVIDTTVTSNIVLPRPYSLGTYVTVVDNGSNPSFFATHSIRITTLPGLPFYGGSPSEHITVPNGALTFVAMTSNWRLVNTAAYVTSGNAVLSNLSTTNLYALSTANLSNLTVEETLTVTGGIDLQNAPTIQGIPSVNAGDMVSTVVGLGQYFLSSVPSMNASFVSTVQNLGTYGYISTQQLQSTVAGLGSNYISTAGLTSTQQGLGTYYLSTPSLRSTVEGLGTLGYVSTASMGSTVQGLGSLYISTASLFSTVSNILTTTTSNHRSTVTKLGSTYVSSLSLVSTVQGISNIYVSPDQFTSTQSGLSVTFQGSITSTVTGLGNVGYISSLSLVSTVTSVQASNLSNVSRTLSTLSNYISSLSLYSTVDGLGTFGYISLSQLTSTTSNLNQINTSDLLSTVQGLGNFYFSSGQLTSTTTGLSNAAELSFVSTVLGLEYLSSTGLQSTVTGLGTFGYISLAQLTSTTSNLATASSNSIVSTIAGLGNLKYISTAQMISTVTGFSNVNQSNLVSTVRHLGCNYMSSLSLQSTVAGLGTFGYISLSQLTSTTFGVEAGGTEAITSTIAGLASLDYISTAQMISTVTGFSNMNESNLVSTVRHLGCNYISSAGLQSTVAGLGTFGYISLSQLTSTTSNLETASSNSITSTIVGLGSLTYISSAQMISTVTGFSNANESNLLSTVRHLGCNYVSSLSLQSTVAGLGTFGYISLSQLTSTTFGVEDGTAGAITSTIAGLASVNYISIDQITSTVNGFSNVNQSNLISTVRTLGCNYISSLSLQSTVAGLGTFGYISLSQMTSTTEKLVGGGTLAIASTVTGLGSLLYISVDHLRSTVTGFSNLNRSNLISTVNTLGFNSNYISTAGLQAAFTMLKGSLVLKTTVDNSNVAINSTDTAIRNSTVQGLGSINYISSDHITSTVTGFSNVNRSNLVSTVTTLGSNYISSLTLQSTVTGINATGYASLTQINPITAELEATSNGVPSTLIGLGSLRYISTAQIVSTVISFSNTNRSNLISTVNTLGSNYISSLGLYSTVAGLGTLAYISTAQLVSTTIGLSPPTSPVISGLQLWLDAADPSGTGIRPGNGTDIDTWVDKSGNARNANGVGENIYTTNSLNGLPGITTVFNGEQYTPTSNYFTANIPSGTFINAFTMFVVYKSLGNTCNNFTLVNRTVTNFNPAPFMMANNDANSIYIGINTTSASATYQLNNPTPSIVNVSLDQVNKTLQFFSNGSPVAVSGLGAFTAADNGTVLYIGTRTDNFYSFNGIFYEILMYNTVLTPTQRDSVELYLETKWGIPGTIPQSMVSSVNGLGGIVNPQVTTVVYQAGQYYTAIAYTPTLLLYSSYDTGTGNYIYTNNYAGTAETTIFSSNSSAFLNIQGLAYDGTNVYAALFDNIPNNQIISISLASGNSTRIASNYSFNAPRGLFLDSTNTNLYVCDSGSGNLLRINLSTQQVTPLTNITSIRMIAIDDLNEYAYVTNNTINIYKVRLSDGQQTPILTSVYLRGISLHPTKYVAYVTGVAYTNLHTIYEVDLTTGGSTLLAGTGSAAYQDGPGLSASFNLSYDILYNRYDSSLYVADTDNQRIRRITLTTTAYISSLSLQATVANLGFSPYFYISTPSLVSTVNGLGTFGYLSTGYLISTTTNLSNTSMTPFVSTTNGLGNIYLSTSALKSITPNVYSVTTVGSYYFNLASIAYTSNYIFYTAGANNNILYRNSFFGNAETVFFTSNSPMYALTCDLSNVYATYNNQIVQINPSGGFTVIANTNNTGGYVDGTNPATVAFNLPVGLGLDSTYRYLYVCDYFNNLVRRIQLNPFSVTTVASIPGATSVAVDSRSEYAYVTSSTTSNVYKVFLLQSNVIILAAFPDFPYGLTIDRSETFAYVTCPSLNKIYTLDLRTGSSNVIVGSTSAYLDGNGTNARVSYPMRIAYNMYDSMIYLADNANGFVRKITTALYTSTITGLTSSEQVQRITASNSTLYLPATSNFVTSAAVLPSIPGLTLWLDGADPYGTGVIPAIGTAITLWTDKSGNTYNASGMREGSLPYALYSNGITFNSANLNGFLTQLPGQMSNQTVFTVFNTPASSTRKTLLGVNSVSPSNAIDVSINNNVMQVELSFSSSSNLVVQTLAGSYGNPGLINGQGTAARFFNPRQLALDSSGNIYVADYLNSTIRKITPAGLVSTYAGNGAFNTPTGVTVNSSGIVYVADQGNYRILKIATDLTITTVAGNGTQGFVDDNGTAAQFYFINDITVDSLGNLYVTDNGMIRKIDTMSNVTTYIRPTIYSIRNIACDSSGIIYAADNANNTILKISASVASTPVYFSGNSPIAYNNSRIYTRDPNSNNNIISIDSFTWYQNSIITQYRMDNKIVGTVSSVSSLCIFSNRYLIVAFIGNNNFVLTSYIFRTEISIPNSSELLFSSGGATLASPFPILACNSNGLYIMNRTAGTTYIYYMTAEEIAKTGTSHAYSTFYTEASSYFTITCDNTYVYITNDTTMYRLLIGNPTPTAFATTSTTPRYAMSSVADFQGNVYYTLGTTNTPSIFQRYDSIYQVYPYFTAGRRGTATVSLESNYHLTIDPINMVLYATTSSGYPYIYKLPVISTLAGSGAAGSADGIGLSATFNNPQGVTVDSSGIVYVADFGNNKIRRIDTSSNVTLFAGSTQGSNDGLPLSAQFNGPVSVAIYSGIVYVSDYYACTIRYTRYLSNTVIGSNTIVANTNTLFTSVVQVGVYNGVNGYLNGVQTLQGSIFDGFKTLLASVNIGITQNPNGSYENPYNGLIQEVIIYNTALSTTDRQSIEAYLRAKWLPSYAGKCNTTTQAITLQNMSTIVNGNLYATNITAATFTAQNGRSGGPNFGFYYGNGQYVVTSSDRRLKEDIRPIQNALEKVSSMQAVRYRLYRDPSQQFIGYVAQDLEVILPEVVRTDSAGWKSIQYTNLPGLIIEAVKELKEKYDHLKLLLSTSTSI